MLMIRVGADAPYLSEVLPGCSSSPWASMTVAPLTATVLDSWTSVRSASPRDQQRCLAVAGAAGDRSSAPTSSAVRQPLDEEPWSPRRQGGAVGRGGAKDLSLGAPIPRGLPVAAERVDGGGHRGCVPSGFHLGIGLAGGLMIIGGLVPAIGIQNPRRREGCQAPRAAPLRTAATVPRGGPAPAEPARAPASAPGTQARRSCASSAASSPPAASTSATTSARSAVRRGPGSR